MTDKELQRLNRGELLQMLIAQMEENKDLKEQLEEARNQLEDRQITIEKSGSLAEAALALNGVFQAADTAAREYLENIRRMNQEQEDFCRKTRTDAENRAEEIVQSAKSYSQKIHTDADEYWQQIVDRTQALVKDYDALRELAHSVGKNEAE